MSVRIVLGPTAFAQVPGLRAAVRVLQQAGLEERLLELPEEGLPEPEFTDRLSGLAARALSVPRPVLIGYAVPSDPVMQKFSRMVDFSDVTFLRRQPVALKLLLPQILQEVGLTTAQSEATTQELLSAAGIEEAA